VLLDDPGRVRSQITSVVYQIQRFDFDCNLVVARKLKYGYPYLYVQNLYTEACSPILNYRYTMRVNLEAGDHVNY
jgi:hypothetical protein